MEREKGKKLLSIRTNLTPPRMAFMKFLGSIENAQMKGAVPIAAERTKRALVLLDKSMFLPFSESRERENKRKKENTLNER